MARVADDLKPAKFTGAITLDPGTYIRPEFADASQPTFTLLETTGTINGTIDDIVLRQSPRDKRVYKLEITPNQKALTLRWSNLGSIMMVR